MGDVQTNGHGAINKTELQYNNVMNNKLTDILSSISSGEFDKDITLLSNAIINRRTYSCFEKRNGKWVNLFPTAAYTLETARRVFQSHLLEAALGDTPYERRLKPVGQKVFLK